MRECGELEQLGFAVDAVRGCARQGRHAQFVEHQSRPDFVVDVIGCAGRQQRELANGEGHVLAPLLDAILALQGLHDHASGHPTGLVGRNRFVTEQLEGLCHGFDHPGRLPGSFIQLTRELMQ